MATGAGGVGRGGGTAAAAMVSLSIFLVRVSTFLASFLVSLRLWMSLSSALRGRRENRTGVSSS